jgi:hypothetical protein
MANGSDDTLGRIANSLESIALAFLGPREAFTEVNGEQLKAVIERVKIIWVGVQTDLKNFESGPIILLNTAASGNIGQATVFPGVGRGLGGIVLSGGVFVTVTDPRAEARSRLRKLLPPVDAEVSFLGGFQLDTVANFGAAKAQEVYLEVARRTTEVAGQTRQGLNGVKDFLTQFNIELKVDFPPAQAALDKLEASKINTALTPDPAPTPDPGENEGGTPPRQTSGVGRKRG